jgi:hypothetical protein
MPSEIEQHQVTDVKAKSYALQRQESVSSDTEHQSSSSDTEDDEIILTCIVGALEDCDESDFSSSHSQVEKRSLDDTDSNE